MKCPKCGYLEDKVLESRQFLDGSSIRRRRECIKCGARFTSYEHIKERVLKVVKRDGRREDFSTEKLLGGINKATEKRPISRKVIENLLADIEDKCIARSGDSEEISSAVVGKLVMEGLYNIDKVAYIRFASVYIKFDDIEDFIKEIKI
ncbi:MAG TPA: transcriptional regulator NrdR [Spirochaetota bacterium]|jgi:transcriptional repressor NrdR|nr:MAG: Transcriptional repressor NrdR [Spirochaetes bacterium ADurb.Bin133]HNZ27793.1 transcriptional regulator NrdR [Spirochaetota bacterium]HOF01806.1 transcriptional regulator NrdR [Spirochaetota bacterium]HOS33730.1 transcriptional regulator NrdR [Spirochaetota bacterium]HOS56672.1 transcriptional regulator NrdR [Spirochaetota bacterium]